MSKHLVTGFMALFAPTGIYSPPSYSAVSYQREQMIAIESNNAYRKNLITPKQKDVENLNKIEKVKVVDLDDDEIVIEQGNTVTELVIIDHAVPDKELFYAQVRPGIEIRELQSDQDGLTQLFSVLAQYRGLTALHILSHAEAGKLHLGNSVIDEEVLGREIGKFASVKHALVDGADLLFYGCDLAKSHEGHEFLEIVSNVSGMDVAASDDKTGHTDLGGDWDLEIIRGDVETAPLFDSVAMKDFRSVLAFSGTLALGSMPTGYAAQKSYQISGQTYTVVFSSTGGGAKDLYNFAAGYVYVGTNDSLNNSNNTSSTMTFSAGETFNLTSLYVKNGSNQGAKNIRFTSDKGGQEDSGSLNQGSNTTVNFSGANWTGITTLTIQYTDGANLHWIKIDDVVVGSVQAATPSITSATYDSSTGNLVVTGTNFEAKSGGANDVSVSKLTITGEGGGGSAYTLTSGDVERDSATQFTVSLNAADKLRVDALLNKNLTAADDGTTYNLAAADDFIAQVTAGNTADATNAITVSNYANPAIASSTYDASTGALVVTGSNFSSINGANNDVVANTFTFTGDGGDIYTLTDTSNVDVTNATTFTLTLSATDKFNVNGILNKNGLNAASGQAYNLAGADNWMAGGPGNQNIADSAATINTSNVTAPAVTSAAYNRGTGVLTVTGTNFVAKVGATNDVDTTKLTLTGEGGETHTLTSANVEITSATSFSVTLGAADRIVLNGLLNKDGTQADDGATNYNLNAADRYLPATDSSSSIADTTNTVTVSNTVAPTITSATYNASTAVLAVSGTGFARKTGATNDIDVSKLSLTGEGGNSYTLTGNSVEVSNETSFTVVLNAIDQINVHGLLNKDGGTSGDNTTYNLAGAEDWQGGIGTSVTIADLTTNGVTVSGTQTPTVTSATYDFVTGVLAVTGTNMVKKPGVTNDVDLTKLTLTGVGSGTRTLTTTNVEITDATSFSVTLNSADKTNVNALFDTNGTQASDAVTYNLNAAEDWMAGADASATVVDATNGVTVSNIPVPAVTSATYNFSTGVLTVTGTDFEAKSGAANDVTVNKITLTGQGGSSYTLTSGTNVEITNATTFSVTLSGADKTSVNALLNKNGTQADDNQAYNIAVADDFIANVTVGDTADTTGNPVTVSSVAAPAVTSATYDFSSGALVVTGTSFTTTSGANNDIDPTKLTLTGDSGGTYILTSSAADITSETAFTITLNAADQLHVGGLLNKNGTTSGSGTTYNLAAADNWMAGGAPTTDIADLTLNGVTVSNVATPTITSATYDFATGALVVTGTNLVKEVGTTNDVDVTKLTLTGDSGGTFTLTTGNVEITDGTTFTVTLSTSDRLNVGGLLNKNGLTSGSGTTYNLAAADNWMAGADATTDIGDLTNNGVTVSNVANPTITSATYDSSTGALVVTGTNLVKEVGATNDVLVSAITLTGEGGGTHALTTANVEITDSTSFTVTLSAADKLTVDGLLNKDGTTSGDNTTYNLAVATRWLQGSDASVDSSDATNTITVSGTAVPTISSATYDASSGVLAVTATRLVSKSGATNDIDVTKLSLTGEASVSRALTSDNVEVTSETSFSVTLNTADKLEVNGLLNKNGTSSGDNTTYNLAAAEDWLAGAATSATIADLTTNGVTVSNVAGPVITSATYDASTGILAVTGTNFVSKNGATNDVDPTKLTITGDSAGTYTLTSDALEVTNATSFSLTLNTADKNNIGGLLNKNGTSSDSGTVYNLAAADNWMAGADTAADIADLTLNAVTVSNVSAPAITSAQYDVATGQLVITGSNLVAEVGAANDVDLTKMTLTGDGPATYTLTSSAVEITNSTQITITLNDADKLNVNGILNKNGTTSDGNTTYNIAAADNWMAGAATTTDIADLTGNGITVSNVNVPTITSATYNYTSGLLSVTGTNFRHKSGAANDVDLTKLSLLGEGDNSYTLTGSSVEVTSATAFGVTLSETDRMNVNGLLNANGIRSDGGTCYNLAAADNWMPAALTATDITDSVSEVTVSNVVAPAITSVTYDHATGVITITGTNFVKKFGSANDIDVSLITFTGENGQTYTLTSAVDIEITSATSFTITLTGADLAGVTALITANGTSAGSGTTYNISMADNWMAGIAASVDIADTTTPVTASNVPEPTITSATYDASTGVLVVTGTDFQAKTGALNDVSVSKLTFTGEAGGTYGLTSSDVEITSATAFSVTLNATDKLSVNGLLNKNGTASDDNTTYNLAAADDFIAEIAAGTTSDATSAVTVSNLSAPAITSATYNAATGVLQVTGTNFVHKSGANNDIDISLLTITGQGSGSYTITSVSDVEVTSDTQFSVTLTGADLLAISGLLNKDGSASDDATTYNLSAADNWATAAAASTNIADTTNALTVSAVSNPAITSATYDASTGVITVAGTGFVSLSGVNNDVDISKLTVTGESNGTYTLTSSSVEVTSTVAFSVTLNDADKLHVNGLFNKNGTTSDGGTAYNIAAADNWMSASAPTVDSADLTGNSVTVSNLTAPTVTSATYDVSTGALVITGSNFVAVAGDNNDVTANSITLTGGNNGNYSLTTANVDVTDASTFTVNLNVADQLNVNGLLNKNGTSSDDNTSYNLAVADNWMAASAASTNIADASNGVTVSGVVAPTITSATYNASTGALAVTGTGFKRLTGTGNDILMSAFTFTGKGSATHTLTSGNVEITSATAFSATLGASDITALRAILDKNGSSSTDSVNYNLAAADNWLAGAASSVDIADTSNPVTVSSANNIPTAVNISSSSINDSVAVSGATVGTLSTADNDSSDTHTYSLVSHGASENGSCGTDGDDNNSSFSIDGSALKLGTGLTANTYKVCIQTSDAVATFQQSITISVVDVTAPTLTSSVPADNATSIAVADNITLTFSENVQFGSTGNITLINAATGATTETFNVANGTGNNSGTVAVSSNTVTINPGANLSAGTSYAIRIDNGAIVDANNTVYAGIADNTTLNFTTQPKVVISASPTSISEPLTQTTTFTMTLQNGSGTSFTATDSVTVGVALTGTASVGTDYTPSACGAGACGITIPVGQSTGTITAQAVNDGAGDAGETIIASITSITTANAVEDGDQSVTVTLTENSAPTVTGLPTTLTVTEDIATNVDVSATTFADAEGNALTVTLAVSSGTVSSPVGSADGVTVANSGTASMTLSGAVANLNSFLDKANALAITTATDSTAAITLTVTPNDGAVNGTAATSTVSVTAVNDVPSLVVAGNASNVRLWVTSNGLNGNIDELDGSTNANSITGNNDGNALTEANAFCNADANNPNLANSTTIAFISINADNEIRDIPNNHPIDANSAIHRLDGSTEIASSWSNMFAGTLSASPDPTIFVAAWTGSTAAGVLADNSCNGFTDSTSSGSVGAPPAGNATALQINAGQSCTSEQRLYCLTYVSSLVTQTSITFSAAEDATATAVLPSGAQVRDQDSSSATFTLTLTLSDTSTGTLAGTASGSATLVVENGVLTLTGSLTDVNTSLASITFTPAANYSGNSATFSLTISDGTDTSSAITGTVNVTAVNDAPVIATNNTLPVNQNGSATITTSFLNEGDPDDSGAGLTYTVTTLPSNGTLAVGGSNININGSFTSDDISNSRVVYTHAGGDNTSDSFSFSLADGGEDSASPVTGVFNISVNDNILPTLASSVPADNATSIAVANNITLTFSENVQFGTGNITLINTGTGATTETFNVATGNGGSGGTVTVSGNTVTLNPGADLSAGTGFAIRVDSTAVTDDSSNTNAFAGIADNTTLNFTTQPKVVISASPTSISEPLTQTTTFTMTLQNGSGTSFTATDSVTVGVALTGTASVGTDYTPSACGAGSCGITIPVGQSTGTFTAQAVNDGAGDAGETIIASITSITTANAVEDGDQSVTVTLTENSAPTVTGLPATLTVTEDIATNVDVSATNFADGEGNSLTVTLAVSSGTVSSPLGTSGGVTVNNSGTASMTLSGTPDNLNTFLDNASAVALTTDLNSTSAITLTVTPNDGTVNGTAANSTVTVTAVNDNPEGGFATATTFDIADGSGTGTTTFTEVESGVTMTSTASGGGIYNAVNANGFGGSTAEILTTSGSITSATTSFSSPTTVSSFQFLMQNASVTGDFTFTVTSGNGSPVVTTSGEIVGGSDSPGITIQPTDWTNVTAFSITSSNSSFDYGIDNVVITTLGSGSNLSFTEDTQGNLDLSTFEVSDVDSSSLTMSLSISAGTLATPADGSSVGSGVTASLVSSSLITLAGSATDINSYLDTASNIQYTPATNANGTGVATLTVSANDGDGSGNVSLATVLLDVTAVNDAPTISTNTGLTVSEGGTGVITTALLADSDPDDTGTELTFTVTTAVTNGTLFLDANDNDTADAGEALAANGTFTQADVAAGNVQYTHNGGETTSDSFVFSLADGGEDGASALTGQTFNLTITSVNDVPVITSTALTTATEDSVYSYTLTATDVDTGDSLTLAAPTLPAWLAFNAATGVLSGTPVNDHVGANNVVLTVTDTGNLSATQSFTITVSNTNDAPVITSTALTVATEDTAYSYTLVANDIDAGDTLTLAATTLPGWLSFNSATGVLSGTPTDSEVGQHAVVLTASDTSSSTDTQSFTITVSNVNDAPVILSSNTFSVNEDSGLNNFSLTASDVDSTGLTWSIASQPPSGAASVSGSGTSATLSYTPDANTNGIDSFNISVSDGALSTAQTITVSVVAVNDTPVISGIPGD